MFTQPSHKNTPQRWIKVAVDYYRNPKIIKVGVYAELAYLRLLAIARERVESANLDGEIPTPLAVRELRDIADAAELTCNDILTLLADNTLITIHDSTIVVDDYARWQTTREEIETKRESARNRTAARRERLNAGRGATPHSTTPNPGAGRGGTAARRAPTSATKTTRTAPPAPTSRTPLPSPVAPPPTAHTTPAAETQADEDPESADTEGGDPMGLYDNTVDPYTDLRNTHELPRKKAAQAVNPTIDPKYAEEVEQVAQHILKSRKAFLGAGQRARIGPSWRRTILNLLKGDTPAGISFTPDQLCDLFDFAAQDEFWRGPVADPGGLLRNAHKIWVRGDYVAWSIDHGRPETNRPKGFQPTRSTRKRADIDEEWDTIRW